MAVKSIAVIALGLGLAAAATVEKRQGPPAYGGGGYGGDYGPAMSSYGAPPMPGYPTHGMPPQGQYPQQNFPDPGFSIQTGFEGYLVPNSWYGLMPSGTEGLMAAGTGIAALAVLAALMLGLFAWLAGFGDFAVVKEAARSLMPSNLTIDMDTLADMTTAVFDALDKYNELAQQNQHAVEKAD